MIKPLTPFEQKVLINKGTEPPNSGLYTDNKAAGTYHCKACDAELYRSSDKFDSHCGWPSFDQELPGAVKRIPDPDGHRTESVCVTCQGHLGHVFVGERFTAKNTRHCVNSVSLRFKPQKLSDQKKALFASGCFWGTEYYMARIPGVIQTTVGYAGGHLENPDYESVCSGRTGHVECVEVIYDSKIVDYETLARLFFETHDFSQEDGQGPDIGSQYLSQIFYANQAERDVAEKLIQELKHLGHHVATTVREMTQFWPAEEYHRQYYERQGKIPYCHSYRQIFPSKT